MDNAQIRQGLISLLDQIEDKDTLERILEAVQRILDTADGEPLESNPRLAESLSISLNQIAVGKTLPQAEVLSKYDQKYV